MLDDPAWADHRGNTLSYEFRIIVVIPTIADDQVETLLVIHATGVSVFDDDGLLTELEETAGYALVTMGRTGVVLTERRTSV